MRRSARFRSLISKWSDELRSCNSEVRSCTSFSSDSWLRMANTRGTSGMSANTVAQETTAVMNFTKPEKR